MEEKQNNFKRWILANKMLGCDYDESCLRKTWFKTLNMKIAEFDQESEPIPSVQQKTESLFWFPVPWCLSVENMNLIGNVWKSKMQQILKWNPGKTN